MQGRLFDHTEHQGFSTPSHTRHATGRILGDFQYHFVNDDLLHLPA